MSQKLTKLANLFGSRHRLDYARSLAEIQLSHIFVPRLAPQGDVQTLSRFKEQVARENPELAALLAEDGEAARTASAVVQGLNHRLAGQSALPFPLFFNADRTIAMLCYAMTRAFKPALVLETGVGYGVASAMFLTAMEKNGSGRLVSIDLPPLGDTAGRFIGAAIPDQLRHRWSLRVGGSRRLLPRVLKEVGEVDLFMVDDATIPSLQKHDLETSWPHIRPGGALIVNDVGEQFRKYLTTWPTGAVHLIQQADKTGRVTAVVYRR